MAPFLSYRLQCLSKAVKVGKKLPVHLLALVLRQIVWRALLVETVPIAFPLFPCVKYSIAALRIFRCVRKYFAPNSISALNLPSLRKVLIGEHFRKTGDLTKA